MKDLWDPTVHSSESSDSSGTTFIVYIRWSENHGRLRSESRKRRFLSPYTYFGRAGEVWLVKESTYGSSL